MSILDDIKAKVSGLLEGNGDRVTEGLAKAGGLADEETGANIGGRVEGGVQKAKDALGHN
jgi:MT0933-like antitoxin protein